MVTTYQLRGNVTSLTFLFLDVKALPPTTPGTNEASYHMDNQRNGPNSWIACSKTLHSLLEQYLNENGTLSSFRQVFEKNSLQEKKHGDHGGEAQGHVTSHEPPPLLHRPTKRSLEHSHATIRSADPKCSRLEDYCAFAEQNPVRRRNETSSAREEMFEKTRTLGNSLKPLGPPPPLLKQPAVYKHEREIRWGSLQKHYTKDNTPDPAIDWRTLRNNGGCKHSAATFPGNVSRNARTPGDQFQRTESLKAKPVSPSSIVKQKLFSAEPVPRQIESPDNSTCGGYAFDHMAMPKIVAVHSVSRGSQDEDEWAKNKAFISRAKANQNKPSYSGASVEERGKGHSQTRSVRAQNQQTIAQGHPRYQETNQSAFGNMTKSSSEEVTFERYVLYHLLSKFQGNVEQVKRVLKQNLMQEWLAYSQGNVDPRQQTFEGVNFYELRKLYEIWCQLQKSPRTNAVRGSTVQTISNAQNSKSNRVDYDSRTNFQQNPEVCYRNNQSSPNLQRSRPASCPQGNSPLHSARSIHQGIPRSSVNPSRVTPNSQHNGIVQGPIRSGTNKDIPIHVQEKIYTVSQNSGRGANRPDSYPASAVYHNQHDTNVRPGNIHAQTSTSQRHAALALSSDMCNVKRKSDDQVKANDIFLTQHVHENVPRNQCETYGDTPQRNVLKQEEETTTTNISLASLLQHFPQTISKPSQNQSLPSVNSPLSPSNNVLRSNISVKSYNESGQRYRHPVENGVRPESREKDAVHGQETKASYLWRFKGGKLISDNMPSINRGERLTEIELDDLVSSQQKHTEVEVSMEAKREVHTSGQQSYHKVSASISLLANEQRCNTQTTQRSSLADDQQHKKVCGAAASGQRCYCVLDQKGCPQSTQKSSDPIQSMQRMIIRTSRNSPAGKNTSPIQSQISNVKIKTERSVSSTHDEPVYQRSDTTVLVSPQANHHSSVHVSQGGKKIDATLDAQGNQASCASLRVSPVAQTSQQSNATFYASRNAQANQQSHSTVTIVSNPQANQHSSLVSPTAQIRQHSDASLHGSHNEKGNQQYNTSRKAQLSQQYNASLHISRKRKESEQFNGNLHAQTNQQSNSSFRVSLNAQATQQPNTSSNSSQQSDVSRNTQRNQRHSNTSFKPLGTAQEYQQSNGSSKASRNSPSGQKSNANPEISKVNKIVPKVEKNTSCQNGNRKKTEASTAIKSERTNDKNCSFLTSLPPKKQYTSLQQLAKKVIETRQRFEMENIPWKKKILKSLEGVLMKRLRKIEKETGEQADLGGRKGFETEASTKEQKT